MHLRKNISGRLLKNAAGHLTYDCPYESSSSSSSFGYSSSSSSNENQLYVLCQVSSSSSFDYSSSSSSSSVDSSSSSTTSSSSLSSSSLSSTSSLGYSSSSSSSSEGNWEYRVCLASSSSSSSSEDYSESSSSSFGNTSESSSSSEDVPSTSSSSSEEYSESSSSSSSPGGENSSSSSSSSFGPRLIDIYPAVAAYSVRLLSNDYTGYAMKIRETGGDTETDISFNANGEIDVTDIEDFCGANDGYIVTWYDQSGNNYDLTQATDALQFLVCSSGTARTENGILSPQAYDDYLDASFAAFDLTQPYSCISRMQHDSSGAARGFVADQGNGVLLYEGSSTNHELYSGANWNTGVAINTDPESVYFMVNGASSRFTLAASDVTGNTGANNFLNGCRVGCNKNGTTFMRGDVQEVIFWDSSQDANRGDIISDLDDYYE